VRNTFALPIAACLSVLGIAPMSATSATDQAIPPPLDEVMTMRVPGEITVDPLGQVLSYRIPIKLPDSVRARLDQAIPGWSFLPVVPPEGKTELHTAMLLTVAATKAADGYRIRLEGASFALGEGHPVHWIATRTFVRSPYIGTNSIVRVAVRVDETGRAVDAAAIDCALHNAGGDAEEKSLMCERLEKISVDALRLARYSRTDMALPGAGEVRVEFTPAGPIDERLGKWRIESRTVEHDIAWYKPEPPARTPSTLVLRAGIVGGGL